MKVDGKDPCPCGSGLRFERCCQDEENASYLDRPEEVLTARFHYLQTGDYARLFASYHPESPFLSQFSDRGAYLRFAEQQLSRINVVNWQALGSRILAANRVEQLLVMQLEVDGKEQYFFELALLVKTGAGWRYHSAQKLSEEDYSGPPEQLDFHHFDHAMQKIRY